MIVHFPQLSMTMDQRALHGILEVYTGFLPLYG